MSIGSQRLIPVMMYNDNSRYITHESTKKGYLNALNHLSHCIGVAEQNCYINGMLNEQGYITYLQAELASLQKRTGHRITFEPNIKIDLVDQYGNPWGEPVPTPSLNENTEETQNKGWLSEVGDWFKNRWNQNVDAWKSFLGIGTAEVPEPEATPTPAAPLTILKEWELKSQVNSDVLKFTQYSDGSCGVEVILPKDGQSGRNGDVNRNYLITDDARKLIDNPENPAYGLDERALSYINIGKGGFDQINNEQKVFPSISAGSDEYYALILDFMETRRKIDEEWKKTFEAVAAFNIIAGTVIGALPLKGAGGKVNADNASFAQKKFNPKFSTRGQEVYSDLAGKPIKTVSDLTDALKNGIIKPSDVPIDYIIRDGNTLLLNTRSSQALTQAGISRSQWNLVNRTGVPMYENMLTGQLTRNKLTSEGVRTVTESGGKK